MTPTISILLPFRNAAETIECTLDSIKNQVFTDYELLAVDDDSQDRSARLVAHYADADPRIRLLKSPGRGIVSALNQGLAEARAELIARMDADDIMHRERLQQQYQYLTRHPELTLLGCAVNLFPEHSIQNGYREYIRWQNGCNQPDQIADEIYLESPFAHPSVMFRRSPVVALGGYREGPFPEDYDLWLRMHHAGHRMAKLPRKLLAWRDYPERTSRVDSRCSRLAFDQLRASYLAKDPRLLSYRNNFVIWGAGRKTRLRCRHLTGLGYHPRAWIDIDPRKLGNRVDGIPVVPAEWLADRQPRPLVLIYVANHGARKLIASELEQMGYRRGKTYLQVG